jgi:peptide/nickel transport system substrate-binding protein
MREHASALGRREEEMTMTQQDETRIKGGSDRVSRRELIKGLAAVGGGLALRSGFGGLAGGGMITQLVRQAEAQDLTKGTLQVAWDQVQDNLDPQTARGNRNWWVLAELYDTLTYLPGYSLEAKPFLAESWTVTPNGRIYTFKLRRGVRFTTGTELTAEAVKYSIDRMQAIKLGPLFLTVAFDRAQVVDRYTVRFHLKFPYAAWPVILSHPAVVSVVDPAFVEAHGGIQERQRDAYVSEHTAGAGAWTIERWDQGQRIVLARNPQYWQGWNGRHVERVILETVPEEQTRLLRLEKGDVDIATVSAKNLPGLEQRIMRQHLPIEVEKTKKGQPLLSLSMMWLNMNHKVAPTNDINVRKGLTHSFNYNVFISQVLNGYAVRLAGMIPRGILGHVDDYPLPEFDLRQAKQFFDAASPAAKAELAKGLLLRYSPGYVLGQEGAVMWQQDLAKIGIRLNLEEVDRATLASMQTSVPGVPLIEGRWVADYPDPDNFVVAARTDYWPPNGFGAAFAGDAKTDDLVMRGRLEQNPDRRKTIYRELELYFRDQYSIIMVAEPSGVLNVWNARATWTRGFEYNPMFHPMYHGVYRLK